MSSALSATFVVPVHNGERTLERCLVSVLRQTGIRKRIIVVDHASKDDSALITAQMARCHPEIELIKLERRATDLKSPSRPLNEGIATALRSERPSGRGWLFRLDADDMLAADDVVASQLKAGSYRSLIMATLVFFDVAGRTAYEYGPRTGHRSLRSLPGKDLYAVAHHATAMRTDFLAGAVADGRLYDEDLETGEDLGATCRLVKAVNGAEQNFAFVERPYCFKELAETTITGTLGLRRVWASHRRLLRRHPEITRYAIVRGLAELALTRLITEEYARRSLQHLAGRNGDYRVLDFKDISHRMRELSYPTEESQ